MRLALTTDDITAHTVSAVGAGTIIAAIAGYVPIAAAALALIWYAI